MALLNRGAGSSPRWCAVRRGGTTTEDSRPALSHDRVEGEQNRGAEVVETIQRAGCERRAGDERRHVVSRWLSP